VGVFWVGAQKIGEDFTGITSERFCAGEARFFWQENYFNHVRWLAPKLFSGLLFWPASKKLTHS
jgi:hypothetical protein